ncbi:MAG TPA: universal stress protein [Acidimicrobiales bacterium]
MGTIAVGYDGSPDSALAVSWAAELARSVSAQLIVVHAVGLLEGAELSPHPDGAAVLQIASSVGLTSERTQWLVLDGDPCSVLLRATNPPISSDLVVVGTKGAGMHSGTLLGSTSLELAEAAVTPLAIVPRGEK